MKIEVTYFSMLYSESGKSFGNTNIFHLFTNIKNNEFAENEFILAYGPGAEEFYYEWINETMNEQNNSNLYDIN